MTYQGQNGRQFQQMIAASLICITASPFKQSAEERSVAGSRAWRGDAATDNDDGELFAM